MGSLNADMAFADMVFLSDDVLFVDPFEEALLDPYSKFNVVVEVLAFRNDAVDRTYGLMADMTFGDMVLPEDPDFVESELPDNLLLRFANRQVHWRPDDQLEPNGYAEVRLAARSNSESSVNIAATAESGSVVNVGNILVDDKDRYVSEKIPDYNFAGRRVTILFGLADGPRKDYRVFVNSYASGWQRDENGKMTLSLQDQRFRLDGPFQKEVFGGGGFEDGSVDLVGRKKPRLIGYRRHLEPLIVDPTTGMRMISSGRIEQVVGGYFGGVEAIFAGDFPNWFALEEADIPEGGFGTCLARGLVLPRPALNYEGPFTVAARGENYLGYAETPGRLIINELLRAGIRSFEIRYGAFEFMEGSAGYFYDGSGDPSVGDIVEQLALSGGVRLATDLQFTTIRLAAPELQTYQAEFKDEEVEKIRYRGLIGPPVLQFRLSYGFNDRVLSDDEITLPEEDAEFKETLKTPFYQLGEPSNYAMFHYQDVALEKLVEKNTLLNEESEAQNLETQLRKFYERERHLFQMQLPFEAMRLPVGAIIRITSAREPMFASGRNAIIVANNRQLENLKALVHVVL